MSAISILKLDDSNTLPISIEEGKTVIGQGAFLQVTDKRVSRNHGVLEVSDGKLYLTPTHTNPCFFKKTPKGIVEIMKKDERRLLENGHIFGLLPDSLYFKVVCPVTENGTPKSKPNRKSEPKEMIEEEPCPTIKKWTGIVKPEGGLDMSLPLKKKRKLPDWMVQMAKSSPMKNSSKPHARKISTSQPSATKAGRKKFIQMTKCSLVYRIEMEAGEEEEVITTTKREPQIEELGSFYNESKHIHFNVLLVMKHTATDEYWTLFTKECDDQYECIEDGFGTNCECFVVYVPAAKTPENPGDVNVSCTKNELNGSVVENSPPVESRSLMVEHFNGSSMQCETLFPTTSGNALPTTIQSDSMNSNPRINSDLERIDTADLIKVSGEGFDMKNISMDTEFEEIRPEEQDRKDFQRINVPMFYRSCESDCKLYVTVNYQRQRMIEEECSEPNGCRIFYDKCVPITDVNEYREFFGHEKAKVIQLPDPTGIQTLNSQQHKLTQDLLLATDRGLTLQMKNGSIYATRKCRCRIYVSTPSWGNGDLLKLERDVETNIFDVENYFKPALTKYMHQKGPRPLAEVIISFGQQFSSRETFNDLLISATVVHAEAQNYLTSIMCTSPITPNIEISRSDNIDKTLDFRYQLIQFNN